MGWRRKWLRFESCADCAGLFASKPAPTGGTHSKMWERACSRRRQTRQPITPTQILEYHYQPFLPHCHMSDALQI
ncbi:hypothetical protein FQ187_02930 [Pseudomonas sp. ANT_J28]|nr:hypothetical protein FQ187_02930 [Pseudomonas sp. ANT_J28]